MKKYKICILSDEFYQNHPKEKCPEILQKGETRPYLVLCIEIDNIKYAIPFRSHVNHRYSFKIVNNRGLKEGLDFTKAVVVNDSDIGRRAHVRPNTMPQIDQNIDIIIRDFKKFLELYRKIRNGEKIGKKEKEILTMTSLKYFD